MIVRSRLRRSEVISFFARLSLLVIGKEACATSHYRARTLSALEHEVSLICDSPDGAATRIVDRETPSGGARAVETARIGEIEGTCRD
jgi:hypothetical protein